MTKKGKTTNRGWLLNKSENTRTIYDIIDASDSDEVKEAFFSENSFSEIADKNKNEHLDMYFEEVKETAFYNSNKNLFDNFYREINELFSVLDKLSYANENKATCQTALNILKVYENPSSNSDYEAIKNKWKTEINQKKQEIKQRLQTLHGGGWCTRY